MGFLLRRLTELFGSPGRIVLVFATLLSANVSPPSLAKEPSKTAAKAATAAPEPQREAPAGSVGGMGDVNVYPKRVVIDQRQRVASVGLFNRASAQSDYDISLTDMMMTPEGRLVDLASVADPAAKMRVKAASSLLRWSPHRVTLGSHDSQTVRIMARVATDLPPGEYRTHFSAIAVPDSAAGGVSIEQATGANRATGIGVTIIPRFGISIPVILRVGETTLTVGLRNLAVKTDPDGSKVIAFTITRDGNRSAFGDLAITVTGTKDKVAEVKGIGVYPEINQRDVQIELNPASDPRRTERGAKLTVTYTDDDFAPGKILAKQDFIVP
jgi:hypothetical protein